MNIKHLTFRSLFLFSVCSFLHITQSFGQAISVTTNGPQTISVNSASLTSNANSNNFINSTKWTKFSVPGQTLKKVIVVGSSTAAGNGASGGNGFVDKLRAYYQSQGIASDIVNLAVAGSWPFDFNINSVLDMGTDILLVSFPSNGYTAGNNGTVMNRYQEIQNACNSRNVQMFVTGTQPRNDFNDADRANLITMNNLLRNAFTDRFIDFLTPLLNTNGNVMKGEYYADGIHPNDAGHEVLFQLVRASNIFRNSISSASNINSPASANTNITGLADGVHRFQVGVFDNGGFAASAVATITVNGGGGGGGGGVLAPFGGTRRTIPGKLEAEEYDNGGQNIAYFDGTAANSGGAFRPAEAVDVRTCPDVGGGYCTGWTTDGEWLKYSVNVTTSGIYNFSARIGTPNTGKSIQLQVDGSTVGTLTVLNTGGYNNWQTATLTNVPLTAGDHVFRFLFNTGDASNTNLGFDINWFNFDLVSAANLLTPYNGTRKSIPGKLEAEEYDNGGQNVAYFDGTPANIGGAFRTSEAVDVRTCPDVGGGYCIGWTTDGEWLKYSVNVTTTGAYIFTARAGTPNTGKSIQLQVDGATVGTLTVVNTGGYNNWQTSTLNNVQLTAGDHVFRFMVNTGDPNNPDLGFDINWFNFDLAQGQSPPTANAGSPQVITLPTSQVSLSGSGAANNGGTITGYAWTRVSGPNSESSVPPLVIQSPTNAGTLVTGLIQGVYVFRLTVTRNDNQTATNDVTVTVNAGNSSTPFTGTRKSIPGKLEAEEYDNGGQNTAYFDGTPANIGGAFRTSEAVDVRTCPDIGGGYCIGWTTDGEWLKYSVNVTTTGAYIFTARAGTPNTGKSIQLQVDGATVGILTVLNTGGYNNWQTSTLTNIQLTAGDHVFRFMVNTGDANNPDLGFDINWFNFDLAQGQSPPTANAGSAQVITLPTSQVSLSGSGAANNGGTITGYAWTRVSGPNSESSVPPLVIQSPTNAGTLVSGLIQGTYTFRLTVTRNDNQTATNDVTVTVLPAASNGKTIPGRIEAENWDVKFGPQYAVTTTDAGGGQKVIGITNGSFMDYNVTVIQSGLYNVNFRVATPKSNSQFQIKSGATILATITIPSTGSWDTWVSVPVTNVSLTAGAQTIRIISTNDANCDFNWTDWTLTASPVTIVNRAPVIEMQVQKEVTAKDLLVSVFPNPAASYFNVKVQGKSMEPVTIRILDIAGRQVQKLQGMPGQTIRFGDKMMNGIYLVEVNQGSERVITKIIKQ